MPALPSFMNYKSNWKSKTTIKAPFSLRRNENPPSTAPGNPPQEFNPGVIDIKDDRSSLDFDGGMPSDIDSNIVDVVELAPSRPSDVSSSVSPPTKLEIDLAPEPLTDWFAANFPRAESRASARVSKETSDAIFHASYNDAVTVASPDHMVLEGIIEEDFDGGAESVIANLETLDASHFATFPTMEYTRSGQKRPSPAPLTIPTGSPQSENSARKQPRDSIAMLTSRLSFSDTPASSALSGTTLARALFSNTFTTFNDNRWSGYRSMAGLTRADSSVLPWDHVYRDRDQFSIGPDAPPMPADAETLYEAPKRPRSERRKQLKRRSSTGSLQMKGLPDLPTTRPNSLVLSPSSEFDILKSPDPWLSTPISPVSPAAHRMLNEQPKNSVTPSSRRSKGLSEMDNDARPPLPDGVRRLPDPLSPPGPAGSNGTVSTDSTDSLGVDDVLGYYADPNAATPLISAAGFRPPFSPIREETSSQVSPLTPLRNERRDSKRLLPIGARSPLSGRARGDSLSYSRRPSDAQPPTKQNTVDGVLRNQAEQLEQYSSSSDRPAFLPFVDLTAVDTLGSDSQVAHDPSSRSPFPLRLSRLPSTGRSNNTTAQPSSVSPVAIHIQNIPGSSELIESSVESADDSRSNHVPEHVLIANDISRPSSQGAQSDGSSMYTDSSRTRVKILPPIPISPINFNVAVTPTYAQSSELSLGAQSASASASGRPVSPSSISSPVIANGTSNPERGRVPPPLTILSNSNPSVTPTIAINGHHNDGESPDQELELGGQADSTSQHRPISRSLYKDTYTSRESNISMGSPPPYYEAITQAPIHPHTPSAHYVDPHPGPGPSRLSGSWTPNDVRRDVFRARQRPPLPAGPRRPSQAGLNSSTGGRNRSASAASVFQPVAPGLSRQRSTQSTATVSSPKFQTPPPKWRGYTMETAKWTFSSAQLQAMVTRAIRQSAEASAIRLLPLEVLDNEIPDEIRTLEAQRTELKTRYKVLTRRRAILFEAFSAYLSGNNDEDSSYTYRLLDDLSEIAITLDRLCEELHSLDSQLAYLDSLNTVHMSSALAMALRKLNQKFLDQVTENQNLRAQLRNVEAERNAAWRQAEWVANELDQMNAKIDSPMSSQASRISAHRKSLARASKAGLQTPSITGVLQDAMSPSSSQLEKKPPVPALPPVLLLPDSPLLSCSGLSTGYTPSSSSMALAKAQDDVYALLGLTNPERQLRRSRSWNRLSIPSPPASSFRAGSGLWSNDSLHPQRALARRSSLPPDSTLAQVSNALAADRNALLITFDMLALTDENLS